MQPQHRQHVENCSSAVVGDVELHRFDAGEIDCFGTARGGVDLRAAVQLAEDVAASPQERQNAYARANKELDGLIVLPAPVRASIERRIAAAIEA